jgi:alpha-galactosidase
MASLMYVSEGKGRAVVFTYLVNQRYRRNMSAEPIRLKGLDPARLYHVTEINLYPGTHAAIDQGAVYSGEFLMSVGINPHISRQRSSVVLEIEEK